MLPRIGPDKENCRLETPQADAEIVIITWPDDASLSAAVDITLDSLPVGPDIYLPIRGATPPLPTTTTHHNPVNEGSAGWPQHPARNIADFRAESDCYITSYAYTTALRGGGQLSVSDRAHNGGRLSEQTLNPGS